MTALVRRPAPATPDVRQGLPRTVARNEPGDGPRVLFPSRAAVPPTIVVLSVDVATVVYDDLDLRRGVEVGGGGGAALLLGDPYATQMANDRGTLVDRYV